MRFRILDSWRVLAALTVMIFHYLHYGPASAVAAVEWLRPLMPLIDMFLIISGVLIMERYGDRLLNGRGTYLPFLLKRLARFYPLYAATLVYFVGIAILVHLGLGSEDSVRRYAFSELPANILLIQGWGVSDQLTFNYVGWTLSAEWFCYLLLPVIVLVWRKGGFAGLAVLIVATVMGLEAAVAAGVMPFRTWMLADTWGAYRAFADFSIGAFIAMASRRVAPPWQSHVLVWAVFSFTIAAMLNGLSGYPVLALLALSIFLATAIERRAPERSSYLSAFDAVAAASFSIYLIHPVVAPPLLNILWMHVLQPMGVISFYAFLPVPVVVAVVLSLLSARYFEPAAARRINGLIAPSKDSRTATA